MRLLLGTGGGQGPRQPLGLGWRKARDFPLPSHRLHSSWTAPIRADGRSSRPRHSTGSHAPRTSFSATASSFSPDKPLGRVYPGLSLSPAPNSGFLRVDRYGARRTIAPLSASKERVAVAPKRTL